MCHDVRIFSLNIFESGKFDITVCGKSILFVMILINIFDKSLDLTFSYSIVVDNITLNILFISKSFAPCYLHLRNMFINTDYNSSCFIADIFKNITQCIKYIFLCAIYNNGYRYGYSKWLFFLHRRVLSSPLYISW